MNTPLSKAPAHDRAHDACCSHDHPHETTAPAAPASITWKVEGMDCGSCSATIRKALERLPGVSQIALSVTNETLTLILDEERTKASEIEKRVGKLGYKPTRLQTKAEKQADHALSSCGHDHGHAHGHDHSACGHDHGANGHSHHGHDETPSADAQVWKVSGMDCGSCAATIRTTLERLPGVSGIKVSITNETLSLVLDEAKTPGTTIESQLKNLGYQPNLMRDASTPANASTVKAAEKPAPRWWATRKGKIALTSGLLVVAAYAASVVVPEASHWVFILATVIAAAPVARRALMAAMAGAPFTIQMLLTIAAVGALFIGAAEEAAIVVFLFAVGEVLEGFAADKARAGIKALAALVPKTAIVEEAGQLREVPADSLRVGQVVLVRPGDRVPADGKVIEGTSSVDESPITGESILKLKEPGADIFSGSINHDGAIRVRVERTAQDNMIARIIALVEEAQEAKAPTERLIDRFSRVYMPFIVGLSALVAVLPPLLMGGDWSTWIYRGLSLLLIGCPCALVISVPAAIASSLSTAARHGLLLKGGAIVESLAKAQVVAFDKTGTLTLGRPFVTDVVGIGATESEVLALAGAIERESNHPLAQAVAARVEKDGVSLASATNVRAIPGRGMEGTIGSQPIFIGAPRFAAERAAPDTNLIRRFEALEEEGKTVALVVKGGTVAGILAFRDEPRADAQKGLSDLKALGVEAVMLTGDNARTGQAIGRALGIGVRAEMMPSDKSDVVRKMAESRHTLMVGDGINDAPALAAAHVGVAMGSGTDVALEAADAALLRNRVTDLAAMIRLSRATMGNIRQNIAIALGLKALFLVTTVTGMTGLWMAIIADTGGTVLVTLNALRLLGFFGSWRGAQEAPSQTNTSLKAAGLRA
ncbi:heavy metal translocating P-type ATPase [Microvirga terricola]|uniref:P-type Zn(2+) transporter n=1 Tax=Microvirga terricola TaxID=2719797 RepID=A0ABX0VI10_9HYPH|nr:heavy metal translocating P-type ATPase [Microvirga terricola]NIX78361.1 cadmium-translocating P-type ATPase [Microvirga terricola]